MRIITTVAVAAVAAAAVSSLALFSGGRGAAADPGLQQRLVEVEERLAIQTDIEEIRRIQFAYNYYNSGGYTKQLLDLVSPNAESIEIGGQGVYNGKAGFERLFGQYNKGKVEDRTSTFGSLIFQVAGMDVITVEPDRKKAYARVRVLTPLLRNFPDTKPRFNGGDYEMTYVREDGRWMISKFKYVHSFAVTFEPDGSVTPGYSTGPSGAEDGPTTWYHPWPETGQLPFHFANPITGQMPPDVTNPKHFWVGNWPGEFGKTGRADGKGGGKE